MPRSSLIVLHVLQALGSSARPGATLHTRCLHAPRSAPIGTCSYLTGCSSGRLHLWQFGEQQALATYTPGETPDPHAGPCCCSFMLCCALVKKKDNTGEEGKHPRLCANMVLQICDFIAVPGSELASISKTFSGLLSFSRSFKQSNAAPR